MTNAEIEAMHARETPGRDPDTLEALSRRYSGDAVILLRLRSGRFAVYNSIREFCGIAEAIEEWPPSCWRPVPTIEAPPTDILADLGLL